MKKMNATEMKAINGGASEYCSKCKTTFTDNFWKRLMGQSAKIQYYNHLDPRRAGFTYCSTVRIRKGIR